MENRERMIKKSERGRKGRTEGNYEKATKEIGRKEEGERKQRRRGWRRKSYMQVKGNNRGEGGVGKVIHAGEEKHGGGEEEKVAYR